MFFSVLHINGKFCTSRHRNIYNAISNFSITVFQDGATEEQPSYVYAHDSSFLTTRVATKSLMGLFILPGMTRLSLVMCKAYQLHSHSLIVYKVNTNPKRRELPAVSHLQAFFNRGCEDLPSPEKFQALTDKQSTKPLCPRSWLFGG